MGLGRRRAATRLGCSSGPALVKNYNGTPTAFGAGLKSHLARLDLPPLA